MQSKAYPFSRNQYAPINYGANFVGAGRLVKGFVCASGFFCQSPLDVSGVAPGRVL